MTWSYPTAADRERRDAKIMEWWEMAKSREWIAEQVDLTPQRVSQIVNGFGATFRGGEAEDNSPR